MEEPFVAEEKRLIDRHVTRFMRLAEYTEVMLDQIGDQLVQLVDTTPPEWGEIPFSHQLYNPIRFRNFRFFPYGPDRSEIVTVYAEFYHPENIETRSGKAIPAYTLQCRSVILDCRTPLYLRAPWNFSRDLAVASELPEDEPPAYPRCAIQNQLTVPGFELWGAGHGVSPRNRAGLTLAENLSRSSHVLGVKYEADLMRFMMLTLNVMNGETTAESSNR